jgi:hypothetical protein
VRLHTAACGRSQIRNPKPEIRNKPQSPKLKPPENAAQPLGGAFVDFGFVSDFLRQKTNF